ncbi:MAG TPA: hypothetical protein DCP91_07990 [Eggerthellaceae bacterium]|nr:hypothetical protein [Eggerthellaceae bacterium]
MAILNNESGIYAANIVQDASGAPTLAPDFKAIYDSFAQRIAWVDGNVVPGAFQMNTAWYSAVPSRDPIFTEHVHDDADELIGFIGSDPDNPGDLGGEIEFTIGGEAHLLTKSTIVFAPAGLVHNPMRILRVDRPIFHFSVVTTHTYDGTATYR